jgi:hypothetical protein
MPCSRRMLATVVVRNNSVTQRSESENIRDAVHRGLMRLERSGLQAALDVEGKLPTQEQILGLERPTRSQDQPQPPKHIAFCPKITEPKHFMPLHDGSNSAFRRVARAV